MSTQPVWTPARFTGLDRPLTVAEYLEIGEVEPGYTELEEGRLLLSPSGVWRHNRAGNRLWQAFDAQLPPTVAATTDIDVDLQLAPAEAPGTVRRPDVVVVRGEAVERMDLEGGILSASDVVLAVEVVSPGSRRLDLRVKRDEYADAGIPRYWIVDLDAPVSLVACHLAGEFGYVDGGAVTGVFRTTEPFPVEVDLDALL
ncbi:MAG: Uma2 family endonuclease [Pseudonocardia sp.]|nr:Uma2 family endonuclease [Pseudonocardia sp.]